MGFLDDYEPVEDRLREFWADHPDGRIETVLEAYTAEGDYIVKALVWREDLGDIGLGKVETMRPSATGYAHDSYDQLPPNMKASALEVCETSAIGRALANLGYAPKGKRPSREEMTKAGQQRGQETPPDAPSIPMVSAPAGPPKVSDAVHIAGTRTSDRSGEGQANPGESGASQTSPEHHYPADPLTCDHRYGTGAPAKVKIGKDEICRLCGTPWISAMESTTADLGPAT